MDEKIKTTRQIGYTNVLIVTNKKIRGFGIIAEDAQGNTQMQELKLKKGSNVIQLPDGQVDNFIYELRKYAGENINDIKLLDFDNEPKPE